VAPLLLVPARTTCDISEIGSPVERTEGGVLREVLRVQPFHLGIVHVNTLGVPGQATGSNRPT
jgi:hypothetical protein